MKAGWRANPDHRRARPRRWAVPAALLLLACASPAWSGWSVVGTAVELDGQTGVPDVRVTIEPDSFTTMTDSNGDFILPWNGERGWVTFTPQDHGPDGKAWCKQVVLYPRRPTQADSTFDVGTIRVDPLMRLLAPTQPVAPPGTTFPPALRVSGPQEGDPKDFWMIFRYHTDLWGHATRIEEIAGEPEPTRLRDAIRDWINKTPWSVPAETRCGEKEPFTGTLTFSYSWQDSVWAVTPNWGPPREPRRGRGRPTGTGSNEIR